MAVDSVKRQREYFRRKRGLIIIDGKGYHKQVCKMCCDEFLTNTVAKYCNQHGYKARK